MRAACLSHAFTLCGTRLDFITEDTIAYRCGNSIAFLNIRTKAQSWLPIEEGYALDCFAVNFAQHLIVCGVHGKASRILIFQYGNPAPIQVIEGMSSKSERFFQESHMSPAVCSVCIWH